MLCKNDCLRSLLMLLIFIVHASSCFCFNINSSKSLLVHNHHNKKNHHNNPAAFATGSNNLIKKCRQLYLFSLWELDIHSSGSNNRHHRGIGVVNVEDDATANNDDGGGIVNTADDFQSWMQKKRTTKKKMGEVSTTSNILLADIFDFTEYFLSMHVRGGLIIIDHYFSMLTTIDSTWNSKKASLSTDEVEEMLGSSVSSSSKASNSDKIDELAMIAAAFLRSVSRKIKTITRVLRYGYIGIKTERRLNANSNSSHNKSGSISTYRTVDTDNEVKIPSFSSSSSKTMMRGVRDVFIRSSTAATATTATATAATIRSTSSSLRIDNDNLNVGGKQPTVKEKQQKENKSAEMVKLLAAIRIKENDVMTKCFDLGHSIVGKGTTTVTAVVNKTPSSPHNIQWMVTDSVGYDSDFSYSSDLKQTNDNFSTSSSTTHRKQQQPDLIHVRTITLRGDNNAALNKVDNNYIATTTDTAAKAVYDDIKQYIEWSGPAQRIVFNGDSKGGSISTVLMSMLANDRGDSFVEEKILQIFISASSSLSDKSIAKNCGIFMSFFFNTHQEKLKEQMEALIKGQNIKDHNDIVSTLDLTNKKILDVRSQS